MRGSIGPISTNLGTMGNENQGKKRRKSHRETKKEYRGVRVTRKRLGTFQVVEFEISDDADIGPYQRAEIDAHLNKIAEILSRPKQ